MSFNDVFSAFFENFKRSLQRKQVTLQSFVKSNFDPNSLTSDTNIQNIFQDFEEILLQKSALTSYVRTVCKIMKEKPFNCSSDEIDLKMFSNAKIQNFSLSEKIHALREIDGNYDLLSDDFLKSVNLFIQTVYSNIYQKKRRKKLNLEDKRLKQQLPIYSIKSELIDFIDSKTKRNSQKNRFLVVIGEAGSGKSTQIVQYLLESSFACSLKDSEKRILITQPRKLAVNSVSKRVAEELDVELGTLVGFHYGETNKTSDETLIDFTTNFQLYKEIIEDRTLSLYSCIIIDEAHERSTETDLIIALLRGIASESNIKVIITSATIDESLFTKFFFSCQSLVVPGRTFPVKIKYSRSNEIDLDFEINKIVKKCLLKKDEQEFQGNLLIFLPTIDQILFTKKTLMSYFPDENLEILQLHSKITSEESSKLFEPSSSPQLKRIILSTNIAEASVTVNNISVVIDSGLENEVIFDPQSYSKSFSIRECPNLHADNEWEEQDVHVQAFASDFIQKKVSQKEKSLKNQKYLEVILA